MGVLDTIRNDGPLNPGQDALISQMFLEHFDEKDKEKLILNTRNKAESIILDEYCDRCDSNRFRNKKKRLVCNCPQD